MSQTQKEDQKRLASLINASASWLSSQHAEFLSSASEIIVRLPDQLTLHYRPEFGHKVTLTLEGKLVFGFEQVGSAEYMIWLDASGHRETTVLSVPTEKPAKSLIH